MAGGYPEGALERLQGVEFDILCVVADVCAKLNLTWFVDSGTCLGAVRHGGFIPWDDDIDVGLPLEDYRTFCAQAPALLPEGYGLYTHATTANYPPLFAKVYRKGTRFMGEQMTEAGFEEGIFVDVFAYCRLDGNERVAARQIRHAARWQRISYLYHSAHPKLPAGTPLRPVVAAACVVAHGLLRLLFSPQGIEKRFDRCLSMGDGTGPWCDIFYATWGTFDTDTLFPPVDREFNGRMFPAPRDAHAYLTTMYGDYLTLPPVEQRGSCPPLTLDFGDGENVMER